MAARPLPLVETRWPDADHPQPLQFQRGRAKVRYRRRHIRLRLGHLLFILALVAAAFTGVQRLALLALESRTFALRGLALSGATHRTDGPVRGIVAPWRGINLFLLDPGRIEAEVESLPWVKRADVARIWPARLRVAVEERTPMALIQDGGALFLVDRDGVRLEAVDPARAPELPRLQSDDGFRRDYADKIDRARECLAGLPAEVIKSLAVVDVSRRGRVGLEMRDNPVRVYLRPGGTAADLTLFEREISDWESRFGRLDYVDLTVPGRAYLGPVRSVEGDGPPRARSDKEVL
jgi:cell division protein FtsQ